MDFCGKCGAPLNGGKYCAKCGAIIETEKRRGNRGIAIPLKLPNTNCGKKSP